MSESSKLMAKWRTLKPSATVSFVTTISIIESAIAISGYVRGLTDLYVLTLISLGVIAVLTSCWTYLTRKLAIGHRPSKKPSPSASVLRDLISRVESMRTTVKSAVIVLTPFLVLVLIPFSFRPSLAVLAWFTGGSPPQLLPTLEFMRNSIRSLMELTFLRKYIYLQNVSAIASALVSLLVGFLKSR